MDTDNVFLFVPNLIGYGRIFLAILSCILMPSFPSPAIWCYLISALLDAVDGHAARFLNQSTKFGAMLDQLTDRCGTACLMLMLSVFYPSYAFFFQMSMCVDISMHWLHLHTTVMQGKGSHKTMTNDDPYPLRIYYTSKPVLFIMCCGNELFYITLYLINFYDSFIWKFLAFICFPIALAKWGMAILQGYSAARNLVAIDISERQSSQNKSK